MVKFKIVRDKVWDEYIVQYILDGHVIADKCYHTEDYEDACNTMAYMRKQQQYQTSINQMGDKIHI